MHTAYRRSFGACVLLVTAIASFAAGCAKEQPLWYEASRGNKAAVERKLAAGEDVNSRDSQGGTPLHAAAWMGRVEMVEFLISKGAEIDARDYNGRTPLHKAAETGQPEVAEALLAHGADPGAKDGRSYTPLDVARAGVRSGHEGHERVVELILARGRTE